MLYALPPEQRHHEPASAPQPAPVDPWDPIRVLCVGCERIADEAAGIAAASRLRRCLPNEVVLVETSAVDHTVTDHLWRTRRLIIVDTITTRRVPPGTVMGLTEDDLRVAPPSFPPYATLYETLCHARQLGLAAPDEVVLVAVEAIDRNTVGVDITPVVRAALSNVVEEVLTLVDEWRGRE